MSDYVKKTFRQHSAPLDPLPTGETAVLDRISGIRAVLFDVYGTMFISASGEVGTVDTGGHAAAFKAALQATGIESQCTGADGVDLLRAGIKASHTESKANGVAYPEIDIVRVWDGVLATLSNEGLLDNATNQKDLSQQLAIEYEVRTNPIWPMPGLEACLESLRNAGMPLGIISNAQFFTPDLFPALLEQEVDKLGFHPQLQFYSYRYLQAKPGRYLYELARDELQSLGLSTGEALFVGNDMLNDITAAAEVGFRTALFAGDARSLRWREGDERVAGMTPDAVATHLDQLATIVGI